eukprot:5180500-Heterocapsa_arctica.AAC.1
MMLNSLDAQLIQRCRDVDEESKTMRRLLQDTESQNAVYYAEWQHREEDLQNKIHMLQDQVNNLAIDDVPQVEEVAPNAVNGTVAPPLNISGIPDLTAMISLA